MCFINCLFLFICLPIFGDLSKLIPAKSMRIMVKVVWTFKNGVEGAVLISSTSWFSFSLLYDRVWVQSILKMSVPILRIYIEL